MAVLDFIKWVAGLVAYEFAKRRTPPCPINSDGYCSRCQEVFGDEENRYCGLRK